MANGIKVVNYITLGQSGYIARHCIPSHYVIYSIDSECFMLLSLIHSENAYSAVDSRYGIVKRSPIPWFTDEEGRDILLGSNIIELELGEGETIENNGMFKLSANKCPILSTIGENEKNKLLNHCSTGPRLMVPKSFYVSGDLAGFMNQKAIFDYKIGSMPKDKFDSYISEVNKWAIEFGDPIPFRRAEE